jgi:hypothetical protein
MAKMWVADGKSRDIPRHRDTVSRIVPQSSKTDLVKVIHFISAKTQPYRATLNRVKRQIWACTAFVMIWAVVRGSVFLA